MVRLRISFDSSFFYHNPLPFMVVHVFWERGPSHILHVSVWRHSCVLAEDIEECASRPESASRRQHCYILACPLRLFYEVVDAVAINQLAVAASESVVYRL